MLLDPETGILLFLVGGIGSVVSFSAFKMAQDIGPIIEAGDMLPAPFPYPPLPRFMFKPRVIETLRKK